MNTLSAEIPKRSLFKAAEVCQLAKVQPYVLRSWEAEFPDLGVAKTGGGPRLYRRCDLERVLRLKQLLFVEGLTLAGARRQLEVEQGTSEPDDGVAVEELLQRDVRERLAEIKHGLRSILEMLSGNGPAAGGSAIETPRSVPEALDRQASQHSRRRGTGRRRTAKRVAERRPAAARRR